MKFNKTICGLFVVIGGLITISCSNLVDSGDKSDFMDWQNGETIAQPNYEHLSNERKSKYQKDAERLAIRYVNKRDMTQTEIPDKLITLLYNGLIHIANSDLAEAKEVTEKYNIHARTPAEPREISVNVDRTTSWLEAWRNGNTQTGDPQVDELINRFDLTLVDYVDLSSLFAAELRADRAINGYAVGRLFEQVDEVESAGPDGITDGSDIKVEFREYLLYTFEYGFGDCPSGCINRHQWQFRVFEDGTVELAGEAGDALPQENSK